MSDKGEQSIGLVDEILEQQTAAALKLAHIDEGMEELRQAVLRMGGEVGALAMTQASATAPVAPKGDHHAVDALEREVGSLKSRLGVVTGVMGLQTLLLIALLVFALKPMSAPEPATAAPAPVAAPPPVVTTPPPENPFGNAAVQPPVEDDKPAEKPVKKKRKK